MTKKVGPDQARSWAIAMAGCIINGLLSGISRTTGLFYVSLIETYGVSRMEANLPFTLRNVVRNLASPLAGAIGQRFGAQGVTFVGGIFAFLGIALCYLAPNVMWICILWGGMHGFGVALGNTLFPVIINQYFQKHRATASGISLSGACVGSFILPVAIEFMLNSYGLSGTFLIAGGLIMNVLPASIMMVEPPWIYSKNKLSNEKCIPNNERTTSLTKQSFKDILAIRINRIPSLSVSFDGKTNVDDDEFQPASRDARVFSRNGVDNFAFVESKTDLREKKIEALALDDEYIEMRMRTISVGEASITFSETVAQEAQETSITKGLQKIFLNPMFYVISTSLAGFAMLFDPAITVIVDYIHDKGLEENDAKYFIILMSIGDLLGRLGFGWVTDRKYMSLARFMLLLHAIQGSCFMFLPLFNKFYVLISIITVYGVASGATLVMYPILVSKYLVSVQSLAIGFIAVFTGIISFAVPPLIGYFRDHVGSYEGMFLITGSLSLVAGILWLFEPLLTRAKTPIQKETEAVPTSLHKT